MAEQRKRVATVILAGIGVVLVAGGVWLSWQPQWFVSTVRLMVVPQEKWIKTKEASALCWPSWGSGWGMDEFEVIFSKVILYTVITNLNLQQKWGQAPRSSGTVTVNQVYETLKRCIKIKQQDKPGKCLIEIQVYSRGPNESAKIARETAQVYVTYMRQLFPKYMLRAAALLEEAEAKVDIYLKGEAETVRRLEAALPVNGRPEPGSSIDKKSIAREPDPKRREYLQVRRNWQMLNARRERMEREIIQLESEAALGGNHVAEVLEPTQPFPRPARRKWFQGSFFILAGLFFLRRAMCEFQKYGGQQRRGNCRRWGGQADCKSADTAD